MVDHCDILLPVEQRKQNKESQLIECLAAIHGQADILLRTNQDHIPMLILPHLSL